MKLAPRGHTHTHTHVRAAKDKIIDLAKPVNDPNEIRQLNHTTKSTHSVPHKNPQAKSIIIMKNRKR